MSGVIKNRPYRAVCLIIVRFAEAVSGAVFVLADFGINPGIYVPAGEPPVRTDFKRGYDSFLGISVNRGRMQT